MGLGNAAWSAAEESCPPLPKLVQRGAIPPSPQGMETVYVEVVINAAGNVCRAQVVHAANPQLARAAEKQVLAMHAKPAQKDGHAAPTATVVKIQFKRKPIGTAAGGQTH